MKQFGNMTYRDAFNLMCGVLIGEGQYRKVYECALNPDYVVKVDDGGRHNLWEWGNWHSFNDDEAVKPWLCPCHMISAEGRILVMSKASPIRQSEIPTELPAFASDLKYGNLGMFEGRLVIIDYAYLNCKLDTTPKAIDWDAKTFKKTGKAT